MEPLFKQLAELPKKLMAASLLTKAILFGGLAVLVAIGAVVSSGVAGEGYQYAFTGLTGEDGAEAGVVLKGAQIPFRLENHVGGVTIPQRIMIDQVSVNPLLADSLFAKPL